MLFGTAMRLSVAAVVLTCGPVCALSLHSAHAQEAAPARSVADTWQGTLHVDKDLRTIVKISKAADGTLKADWYSIDQTPRPIGVSSTTLQGNDLVLKIPDIDGVYTGKLSADRNTLTGEWKQGDGKPLPLLLTRATKETAWAIPEPPKPVAPMAADANPSWDVATIKLSPPDAKGKGFGGPPRQFETRNTTLSDIVMFAFDLNSKQIVNAPAWMDTDHFDIKTGEPDVPGAPSLTQLKAMLRKLLADRFAMKFHNGKQEMSAYVLTVAKDGIKLKKSDAQDGRGGAFYFTKLGRLVMKSDSMDDICHGFQGAVFDRPVVNRTGLAGQYDGTLNWTPDETQFAVFNVKIVPDESPDAPPPIFTAIQQQDGLKLEAQKTAVDVMILDHVEKPSEN